MIKASLDRLAETEDIEVIWRSFELRPQNAPPVPEEYKARIEAAWSQTSQTAKEHFGVEMRTHRLGMNSRLALEGAKYAEEQGFGETYHEAMFKAHFIDDRDFRDFVYGNVVEMHTGMNPDFFKGTVVEDEVEKFKAKNAAQAAA